MEDETKAPETPATDARLTALLRSAAADVARPCRPEGSAPAGRGYFWSRVVSWSGLVRLIRS